MISYEVSIAVLVFLLHFGAGCAVYTWGYSRGANAAWRMRAAALREEADR